MLVIKHFLQYSSNTDDSKNFKLDCHAAIIYLRESTGKPPSTKCLVVTVTVTNDSKSSTKINMSAIDYVLSLSLMNRNANDKENDSRKESRGTFKKLVGNRIEHDSPLKLVPSFNVFYSENLHISFTCVAALGGIERNNVGSIFSKSGLILMKK